MDIKKEKYMSGIDLLSMNLSGFPVKNWMQSYGHEIHDGKILFDGSLTPVKDVFDQVVVNGKISSNYRYDKDGFNSKVSYVRFKELVPTHQRQEDGKFYLVVKSTEHIFMELIDDKGRGYSLGLCGPFTLPLFGKRGAIVSPDPAEASLEDIKETHIELTKDEFEKVKTRINKEKQSGNEYFHLLNRNCSKFVASICKEELNIKMNNKEFFSQALARKIFQTFNISPSEKFLKVLAKIATVFRAILSPIIGFIYLLFGVPFDSKEAKSMKQRSVDAPKQGFIDKIKCVASGECFKFCSAWKVMNWQDRVVVKHGSNKITSDQARKISCPDYLSLTNSISLKS
jgi:hypothetical protein